MNPVLLKPQSDIGAQVVVHGRVVGAAAARDYHDLKPRLMAPCSTVTRACRGEADLVLIEGAGSAAEVNLRERDIANMGFARVADTPVVLIGDIDRGGVIAQLVGTQAVLAPEDAAMIVGFLVNKFRGDPSLFDDGMRFIAERTGWRALGLVPFFAPAASPARGGRGGSRRAPRTDSAAGRHDRRAACSRASPISTISIRCSWSPTCALRHGPPGRAAARSPISSFCPARKATIADLAFLRAQGWDIDLFAHVAARRARARVVRRLSDARAAPRRPRGVEGAGGRGRRARAARRRDGPDGRKDAALRHRDLPRQRRARSPAMKCTSGAREGRIAQRPLLRFADGREDGAISCDGRVMGAYAHALFADDAQRAAWLAGSAPRPTSPMT